jgi:hypothetical protein
LCAAQNFHICKLWQLGWIISNLFPHQRVSPPNRPATFTTALNPLGFHFFL